jgi:hypothetical protein
MKIYGAWRHRNNFLCRGEMIKKGEILVVKLLMYCSSKK